MDDSERTRAYARYEAGTVRWTECDVLERDPATPDSLWRFRGTDVPLALLFRILVGGATTAEFMATHAAVDPGWPAAVLEFIATELDEAHDAIWSYGGPRLASPPALRGSPARKPHGADPGRTCWAHCSYVSRNAERMSGAWCVGYQRFPVSIVFTNLASMGSVEAFTAEFSLTTADVMPLLWFLADELDRP